MLDPWRRGAWDDFLRLAVQAGKAILVAGQTGSGKTTLMNALSGEIPPRERIVTIEDVRELRLDPATNHVHLLYGTPTEGRTAAVSATELLRAALRMAPTRILLAELRGEKPSTSSRHARPDTAAASAPAMPPAPIWRCSG